jgi:hypothetical protein
MLILPAIVVTRSTLTASGSGLNAGAVGTDAMVCQALFAFENNVRVPSEESMTIQKLA